MGIPGGLKFAFFSRGLKNGLFRLRTINKRFGFTPKKQIRLIEYYLSVLKRLDVKATFFIPARVLKRYIKDIRKLENGNIEWGIHGFVHTDLSKLEFEDQREHIAKAIDVFDRCKIPFKGFRAPYLRTNTYTFKAVASLKRFLYLSCDTLLWDDVYGQNYDYFKWVKDFYNPILHSSSASYIRTTNGIAEIPVSLPDDDTLVDRENLDVKSLLLLWKKILRSCHEKNEIFVLQLHPERIYELDSVLFDLVKEAKSFNPPIWIATLGELAEWKNSSGRQSQRYPSPYQGLLCITGDIDSITVTDFIIRLKEWH